MDRSTDRIRTTHVGSLIRPQEVLDFLTQQREGTPIDEAAQQKTLKTTVAEVVKQQVEAGVDMVSDGEFGKSSFLAYAHERLSGFTARTTPAENPVTRAGGRDRSTFPEFYAEYDRTQGGGGGGPQLQCTGPLVYTGQAVLQRDLQNFREAMTAAGAAEGFVAAIAPGNFGRGENDYYKSEEEYVHASAMALREEYRGIVDAGFVLQIDAPVGSYDTMALTKEEFRRRQNVAVDALNEALAGIPPERVRYHVCWGSWNAPHTFDIPLIDIVDIVLRVNAQAISLEAANPRHEHEFQVWDTVTLPEGRILLPGLVGHATNIVEHPELVAWRVKNFARLVGRENVIASTDCGFAQGAFTRRVHPTIMWAKLRALREGADLASKELWK